MPKYVTLPFNKKLNLLRQHSLGCDWPDLDQEHWCLHCGQKFNGHMARVWQEEEDGSLWLECGTAECAGSPIDWAPYPWWDPEHPATKKFLSHQAKPKRKRRTRSSSADDDIPF